MKQEHQISIHRACKITKLSRSAFYYESCRDDRLVQEALRQHVERHPTHGFPKAFAYLRKAGHVWNHKRVHRVYVEMKLHLRRKHKRRLPARVKLAIEQALTINQTWSVDFMQDSLTSGRKFRTFNVMDDYNREVLAIEIDFSLPSQRIIRTLEQTFEWRGKPRRLRMDNGPEFISHEFELWCKMHQIELLYIQPGKPMQNALIERLNGTYRRNILDAYLFEDLQQVRILTEQWMDEYNERRPHESLNNLSPREYLLKYGQLPIHKTSAELTTFQQI